MTIRSFSAYIRSSCIIYLTYYTVTGPTFCLPLFFGAAFLSSHSSGIPITPTGMSA
ncbi:hypothetical protein HMPREF0373_01227 [Eubacterium ramulus ATCC 29099]|uniref:Uncharacterized protein n=1 Tax=Eubacterium ramulus ATCC 29099 TaxID=1256908 RepID=U2PVG4_EUBRA|nr:hypothetical protein HMPREF0373_01227 [Eubacterium ramulus ATCC 29099]